MKRYTKLSSFVSKLLKQPIGFFAHREFVRINLDLMLFFKVAKPRIGVWKKRCFFLSHSDIQILCWFGVELLEKLLTTLAKAGDTSIHQQFSLLLMDTLVIVLKSCKVLPLAEQRDHITERCRTILGAIPDDCCSAFKKLKGKFREMEKERRV